MATVHRLSRRDARRVAVRAQLLTRERPTDFEEMVAHLTFLQLDQTSYVTPSANLVAWSRLGAVYAPEDLRDALHDHRLVDVRGLARPAEDMVLYRAEMAQWPGSGERAPYQLDNLDWVGANDQCRRDVLAALRDSGPLPLRELPDTCVRPWRSSGWNNDKTTAMLVDLMIARGEVAVAGREGRDRLFDLAERIYPDDPPLPLAEAEAERNRRRLAALGIARARATACPADANAVGEAGELAEIDGVRGVWRVDASLLDQPFSGRVALLSPLDRLIYDRKRTEEIFEFDYALEMYKPVQKRRWGYYALPILQGDRLIGKVDAKSEHRDGTFVLNAVHEDEPFSSSTAAAVDEEIAALAQWLHLELVDVR